MGLFAGVGFSTTMCGGYPRLKYDGRGGRYTYTKICLSHTDGRTMRQVALCGHRMIPHLDLSRQRHFVAIPQTVGLRATLLSAW